MRRVLKMTGEMVKSNDMMQKRKPSDSDKLKSSERRWVCCLFKKQV